MLHIQVDILHIPEQKTCYEEESIQKNKYNFLIFKHLKTNIAVFLKERNKPPRLKLNSMTFPFKISNNKTINTLLV